MEPITCHMDPISEQVEIHLQVEGHPTLSLMDARVHWARGSRERKLLALPTLGMYLPLSKFESIQRA